MNQGNQQSNSDPTQDALRWIAQALDDHKASLPPAAREAYVMRGQAALQQVQIELHRLASIAEARESDAKPEPGNGQAATAVNGKGRGRKLAAVPAPTAPAAD